MLLTTLAVVGVLVLLVLILAAVRPAEFRYVRATTIQADPVAVFSRVNDLRRFQEWSPWSKLDPNMKQSFEGPPAGPAAVSRWEGNNKVGAGRMTITESKAGESVRMRLEFLRPFKATNLVEFTFRPAGGGTQVEWAMSGRNNLPLKIFGLFMNMDKLIGRDFEKGLSELKALSEGK
jgi:hypothetical protein